ncbi:MAG: hypothetical protein C0403_16245, partial [Desulfobacterium sp.]|nr:hypothetical protein [Desulfobacterium sp.]
IFIGLCMVALPFIVFSALSHKPEVKGTQVIEKQDQTVDHQAKSLFDGFTQTSMAYMDGSSSERTLSEYYSRRQYMGSPPLIPHKITAKDDKGCITCHAKGGWAKEFKRFTPVTPHPEKVSCRQCHVKSVSEELFVETNWQTVAPPLLGRSPLPGGPPPVPHSLQMRENCIACHVGPGAVTPIRVEHPMRGNCRQCHVPETTSALFERDTDPSGSQKTQ